MRPRRPDGVALSALHRRALYGTLAALFVSGAAWSYLRDVAGRGVTWLMLPLLTVHGSAAMLAIFLVGTLLPRHIAWSWAARRNRAFGALIAGVVLVLAITGLALYYAGGESLRAAASVIHLVVGLGSPTVLIAHIVIGRRSRPNSRR